MPDVLDPIERLRAERPVLEPRDALASPRCTAPVALPRIRPARRRFARVSLVAAVAAVALFTGVFAVHRDGASHRAVGISVAEAKARAIDALQGVGELKDYTSTQTWSATEIGGAHRIASNSWSFTRVGDDTRRWSSTRNDWVGIKLHRGLEHRVVDGYMYESRGHSNAITQPWLLDVLGGWTAPGSKLRVRDFQLTPRPNFTSLIAQLKREGLIDARRDGAGAVLVSIHRRATELSSVTPSTGRGADPVTMFAGWLGHEYPNAMVTVAIRATTTGDLNVRMSANYPSMTADGHGGHLVMSHVVSEQQWTPATEPIPAPDPKDVMVVGNVLQARQGARGSVGPLGTLDTISVEHLRTLQLRGYDSAFNKGRSDRASRPARHYPKVWAARKQEMRAFRAAERELQPFDRAAFARDSDCTPFWPSSRRAMDAAIATKDPEHAGWSCDMGAKLGTFVILPGSAKVDEWQMPHGGLSVMG